MSEVESTRQLVVRSFLGNSLLKPVVMVLTIVGNIYVARFLGPANYSTITTFTALTTGIAVLSDLGLGRSLTKILPSVSAKAGAEAANVVCKQVANLKAFITLIVCLILWCSQILGIINLKALTTFSVLFFVLLLLKSGFTALANQYGYISAASFQQHKQHAVDMIKAIYSPFFIVLTAIATNDPMAVLVALTCTQIISFFCLRRFIKYDRDADQENIAAPKLHTVLKENRRFIGATYIVFLFNRFVLRLPLFFVIISFVGCSIEQIAEGGVAIALVANVWMLVNIPISGLRSAVIGRLLVEDDERKLFAANSVMVGINVLISCVASISMLTFSAPLLGWAYGSAFENGVAWGSFAGGLAAFGNVFALGNTYLHMAGKFRQEFIAIGIATLFLVAALFVSLTRFDVEVAPHAVLISIVLSRIVFWISSDLFAEIEFGKNNGCRTKLNAGIAFCFGAFLATKFDIGWSVGNGLLALFSGVFVFLVVFRVMGGIGLLARETISGLVNRRIRWLVKFV